MRDQVTGLPLRVTPNETVGPYIRLAYDQLDEVRKVLDSRGISYSVKETIVSLSGGPFVALVYLRRGADANAIQAILDSVS